jgi:D-alanyl-D-alanine carboxypeptidase (penicillin-binding protein 5/6)
LTLSAARINIESQKLRTKVQSFEMRQFVRNHRTIVGMIFVLLLPALTASALSTNTIPAKAAVIIDSSGAVLFSKYPNAKLAPASTVKLVTAMVVLDSIDPSMKVKVSRNAASVRSIEPKIQADEEMTVSDLLHLALMKSINSAAVALAEAAAGSEPSFVTLMNRKARDLGATTTLFANASGLPKGHQYTTVSDLAVIMKAALSYPLIREILAKKAWLIATSDGRMLFVENSNDLLWQKDNIIGGKTGYTGNARHCFVCAINTDKGPFYTAVLGARSRSSLWRSTLMLAEIGMNPELAVVKEPPRRTRRTSQRAKKSAKSTPQHVVAGQSGALEQRADLTL